jgi:NADH:ubiquinone oxidoreductase subunit 2 (subunit N)
VEKNELEATLKYQFSEQASFMVLFAIGFIYWGAKTLNIADIRTVFSQGHEKGYYLLVRSFF